nr:hypothetical protein CFP56_11058 [Quercus suber]
MKDSDDYITRKAANPRTGLISPSVKTSSPVSFHTTNARDLQSTCVPMAAAAPRCAFSGDQNASKFRSKHVMDENEGEKAFRDDKFVLRMPSAQEPQPFDHPGCSSEQIQVREHSRQKSNGITQRGHNGSHMRNTLHCATYAPARGNSQLRFSSVPNFEKPFPYTKFKAHGWDAGNGEWLGNVDAKHARPRRNIEIARSWPASSQSRITQERTAEAGVRSGHGLHELQNHSKALSHIYRKPLGVAPRPRFAGGNQDADPGAIEIDMSARAFQKGCNRGDQFDSLSTADSNIRRDPAILAEILPNIQLPHPKTAIVVRCESERRWVKKRDGFLGCGRQNCNMALVNRKRQSETSLIPAEHECSSRHFEMPKCNDKTILQVTLEMIVGSALLAWDTMRQTPFQRLETLTSPDLDLQQKCDILKALLLLLGHMFPALALLVLLSRLGQAAAQALDILLWPLLFPCAILKWLADALSHR